MSMWATCHADENTGYKFEARIQSLNEPHSKPYLECNLYGELAHVSFYFKDAKNAREIAAELNKMADALEEALKPVPVDSSTT